MDQTVETSEPRLQKFRYFGRDNEAPDDGGIIFGGPDVPRVVCPEHIDCGLLTFVVKSGGDGLQIFDQQDTTWVDVEGCRATSSVLVVVFVGHTLEAASGGVFRAARHRVVASESDRWSLVYKMRAQRDVWLPHADMSVADLITAFESEHATVNPQAGTEESRASAVGGSVSSPLLRRSIENDDYPECVAVIRRGVNRDVVRLVGQTDRCAIVHNAYFRLWVLKHWSRQCKDGDLGGDVRKMITDLSRPPVPTTFQSLVDSAVQFANRLDEPNHDEANGPFVPWTAATVRFVKGPALLNLGSIPPQKLAIDALDITHSIADLKLLMLPLPAALAEDNNAINIKVASQDGTDIFFRCRMNTQLVALVYAFCDHRGISPEMARFIYDTERIRLHDTPFVLGMEDGDSMHVMVEQMGD